MERLFDKTVVIAGCLAIMIITPFSTTEVVALLSSLVVSGLFEAGLIPTPLRRTLLVAYLVLAVFFPAFGLFVPLIIYDCFRTPWWPLRVGSFVPIAAMFAAMPLQAPLFVLVAGVMACGLSFRSNQVEQERLRFRELRDDLREVSLALENKNRDLLEKQDYEVTLATLNERGRIAREIHDNVGHLLTRSVLQVEALQVVHADDSAVKEELSQVGETLHEALDTVRVSVHDLHDDSFDLHTQLLSIARNERLMDVEVEYEADAVPSAIGYCFVAIVREAIANAAKHGDADRVAVSVVEYPAFYRLTVHDNGSKAPGGNRASTSDTGVGDASSRQRMHSDVVDGLPVPGGIGLRTMEDRARALGGLFRTDYDHGFRVFVSIPKEDA